MEKKTMKLKMMILAVGLMAAPLAAFAVGDMPDWIKAPTYDCASCHRIATKLVGPPWKDVAAKYKGQAGAEKMLMEKVRKGGKGNWDKVTGGVPMSPHPNISDADLKKVLDFELSQ
jgi:cytochrome c